jgi:hypothetical protein
MTNDLFSFVPVRFVDVVYWLFKLKRAWSRSDVCKSLVELVLAGPSSPTRGGTGRLRYRNTVHYNGWLVVTMSRSTVVGRLVSDDIEESVSGDAWGLIGGPVGTLVGGDAGGLVRGSTVHDRIK